MTGFHAAPFARQPGTDAIDLIAHVDAIRHRPLVGVLRDQVLVEEPQRMLRRRGRQPDQEGIEILQHLPPQIVDRAVALVRHDEIIRFDGDVGVVFHRQFPSPACGGGVLSLSRGSGVGAVPTSNIDRSSFSSSYSSPFNIEYSAGWW